MAIDFKLQTVDPEKPNQYDTLRENSKKRMHLYLNRKYTYWFVVDLFEGFLDKAKADESITSLSKLFSDTDLSSSYFKKFNKIYEDEPYVWVLSEKIIDIIEDRLVDCALTNEHNATFTNNVLQNKFWWAAKNDTRNENINAEIEVDDEQMSKIANRYKKVTDINDKW